MLSTLDMDNVGGDAETWEKVVRKLHTGMMPPVGAPRPNDADLTSFLMSLEAALDRAAASAPNPGRPVIHRLNRVEYTNAIRELLGLAVDGESLLPADDSGYGFDNIADLLRMSPALLERYLLAAQKISRTAVGDPTIRAGSVTYSFPLDYVQDGQTSEDLPFGSRGIAVRHQFTLDGDYVLKVGLQRNTNSSRKVIRGLSRPTHVDLRLDGVRVNRFTLPARDYESFASRGVADELADDNADEFLQARLPISAGERIVSVTFPNKTWYVEGVGMSRLPSMSYSFQGAATTDRDVGKIEPGVETVEIIGPIGSTPTLPPIFTCRPLTAEDQDRCAKTILSTLARRAYRRPVTEEDVQPLLEFYEAGRAGGSFREGVQRALAAILTDPEFLFRIERDPHGVAPGTVYRLSDIELASRLSFFLWSSVPDDELLELAERGKLSDPLVLERQVHRMLSAPRAATALVNGFFSQWLEIRDLPRRKPNTNMFPEFDGNLREAFQRETELFLTSQLVEDRMVTELLTADYTFVNEPLARHYGVSGVYGSHFRRVSLNDSARRGLLGQGSILTVTSYANRTSPVVRGKWVLEKLLGAPPPPPPANVPLLDDSEAAQVTSIRERLEQHRRNPVCARCHVPMDPLGFALENFDPIGAWRTHEASNVIDPSGTLPDGARFDSLTEFRTAFLESYQDAFVVALTEKLLTYALGRGVEYYDMPAVRRIVRESASANNRWSALVTEIVRSVPFSMRRSES